jgi:small subunit ribosomal protein S35
MAAALQGFRFAVRSCNCRYIAPWHASKSIGIGREFSTTPLRRKEPSAEKVEERISKAEGSSPAAAEYQNLKREQQANPLEAVLAQEEEELRHRLNARTPPFAEPLRRKKLKQTFMNLGEAEPWEEEGMLDDEHDDITSLAHGELEQHREMRHYARLAAWEMPLLSSMWYSLISAFDIRLGRVTDRMLQNWRSHFSLLLRTCR